MKKKELEQQQIVDLPGALEEIARLEKENGKLRREKKVLAISLITAGFILLIFSFANGRIQRQKGSFFHQAASSSNKAVYSRAPIQTPGANIR